MKTTIISLLDSIWNWLHPAQYRNITYPQANMGQLVQDACQERVNAERIFNSVTDPELIDRGIHLMSAADHRINNLIRHARNTHQKPS